VGLLLELVPVEAQSGKSGASDSIVYRLSSPRSRVGTSAGLLATGI
jgi:hypothetical protein